MPSRAIQTATPMTGKASSTWLNLRLATTFAEMAAPRMNATMEMRTQSTRTLGSASFTIGA